MVKFPIKTNQEQWYPIQDIENLHKEMNRLLGFTFPGINDGEAGILSSRWAPALDIYDTKDNLVIKADLPGLEKEEIDVSVVDNRLTIRGEKKKDAQVKEEDYLRTERYYGSFQRMIVLPAEIDANKVNATFKDGVLELTLGKKEEAKPKHIKVDIK